MEEEFEASGGEWREYRIVNLFDVKNTHNILSSWVTENSGLVPYVTASQNNNSVSSYIEYDKSMLDEGNSIFIGGKTLVISYQEKDYFSNDSHNLALYFKNEEYRTKEIQLYMVSALYKSLKPLYSWGNSISKQKIQNDFVSLPTLNNELAFSYMENYIKALEAERIETLEAYLTVTNLRDYHLTKNDEKVLDKFAKLSDTKSRVEESEVFQLSQVFNLSSSKKKFNANMIEFGGKFPYVARGDSNNGIRGYITESEEFLNTANTISFGQDTATMFYQKEPYFTGDKIKVLRTKEVELDRYKALYLITSLRKSFSTFSWGSSSFNEKVLKETDVKLPIKNNQIDYTFMSDFVRAVEKLVIKDLVIWADKKIAATKEVVAR